MELSFFSCLVGSLDSSVTFSCMFRVRRMVIISVSKSRHSSTGSREGLYNVYGRGLLDRLGEYLKWCDDTQDENKVYHQARAESREILWRSKWYTGFLLLLSSVIRQMDFERAVEEKETMCEKEDKVRHHYRGIHAWGATSLTPRGKPLLPYTMIKQE